MMHQIKEMFNLQNSLNISTNGDDWRNGLTKEGNPISWNRCIYMEAAEAIDSFPWKHWKDLNTDPDWVNLRVEVIDIWHFIMSQIILEDKMDIIDNFIISDPDSKPCKDDMLLILEDILIHSAMSSKTGESNIEQIASLFFTALSLAGMSVEDLYVSYIVKNQLNIFRQNNGYKEGTYIKIWDAIEDNVIALNIMHDEPTLSPSKFYKKLEDEYSQLPEFTDIKPVDITSPASSAQLDTKNETPQPTNETLDTKPVS
jgi:dimeric dUTPase (all-alpha-NTP-PPase superfamily)